MALPRLDSKADPNAQGHSGCREKFSREALSFGLQSEKEDSESHSGGNPLVFPLFLSSPDSAPREILQYQCSREFGGPAD